MRGSVRWLRTALALAVVLSCLPALAAEGRIPVWLSSTVIGPGQEGQYILTRNIFAGGGVPAIDILPGTQAVEIDLNGFTIYGADYHVIQAINVDSVVVRNGTIMGPNGFDGIFAADCRKFVVEDVKIEWEDVAAGGNGISFNEVGNFALRRNIVFGAGLVGILLDGSLGDPRTFVEGTVQDNLIRDCGVGIQLQDGSSVGMINNRIEKTLQGDGIFTTPGADGFVGCLACLLKNNTIQEAAASGMWLTHFEASKVYNNVVTFSGAEGIYLDILSQDNLILDNVSGQNGANGMLIDSPANHIERNVLNTNGTAGAFPAYGLRLNSPANTYRGNTAQGNPGPPGLCPGAPATTDFCDATGGANNSPFAQGPLLGDNLMPGLL